jgi:hypothetical protein
LNSSQDSAWLAGLLEGEGCFRVKHHNETRRSKLEVSLGMGDKDVVEHAYEIVGQTSVSIREKPDYRKETFKLMYVVGWHGMTAENIMRRVYPYMGARRKTKIDECLSTTNLSHHTRTRSSH